MLPAIVFGGSILTKQSKDPVIEHIFPARDSFIFAAHGRGSLLMTSFCKAQRSLLKETL